MTPHPQAWGSVAAPLLPCSSHSPREALSCPLPAPSSPSMPPPVQSRAANQAAEQAPRAPAWDTTLAPARPDHTKNSPVLHHSLGCAGQVAVPAQPQGAGQSCGQEPAELSRPAVRGDTALTGQIETGSKRLENCSGVFNTDMTSWPGATSGKPRWGMVQGSSGCWDRHAAPTRDSQLCVPSCRTPLAHSTTQCVTPPQTSPPSPNLLPGACSRLLSRLIFKYLISSRIFSTLGGKVGGWEGGIKIRLCHRSQERLLYPHSQLAPANHISEFMLILSLIITSQSLRNKLSGKHPS